MKKIGFIALFATVAMTISAQNYTIAAPKSNMKWVGEKIGGEHTGNINIKSGSFVIKDKKVVSGTFTIDMTSITCTDITNESMNQKLVGHLKSDDFFGVDKFPESKFVITESGSFEKGSAIVKGKLTIKGITNPIEFRATFQETSDGLKIYGNAVIDRTKYDIRFGSGSFFSNLGDKTIYDEFSLKLDLLATKK